VSDGGSDRHRPCRTTIAPGSTTRCQPRGIKARQKLQAIAELDLDELAAIDRPAATAATNAGGPPPESSPRPNC